MQTFLEETILSIESSDLYVMKERSAHEKFDLYLNPSLLDNLSGGMGTYIVRAILKELGVNENQVLQWRLENKFMQYEILNYYIPGCMAKTYSLSQVLSSENGSDKVKSLLAKGFFLKATLGDSSGRSNRFDRTDELASILKSYTCQYNDQEKWILQEKLDLEEEFRIHTFGRDLIYGLSFRINGGASDGIAAQEYVISILQKLPHAFLEGSLIGWDIGITKDKQIYIIEANFTGFHPEYGRGFQTSGYFGDAQYGPIVCAWLNNYFRVRHHISIGSVENALVVDYDFFKEFVFYKSVLTAEHLNIFKKKLEGAYVVAMIYLGHHLNSLLIKLVKYFQMINLADRYFVIADENLVKNVKELFIGNYAVKVFVEQQLFTDDQLLLREGWDDETRKAEACWHALQLVEEKVYVIV
jgi:hypothetical protein